ncbi:agmatinase [Mycolicibacterium smegmatis]|uniref:agmatinase n=1 Tax=Mycolicibacterium smegmatis TaxID=1772 RepID=UPI0005D9EFC6|nr:agmatinase [Mycolicibacterium smegmatis]MDF1897357.1 agmatinase [Mycolicibacterium smegmatis]MDF1904200.1 agmatinase [Mycolicibacterium smegmatis]MDF1916923.1 agmatinase [Mycolicibacterium smegmatis]MDF1922297.1 agmatinase [Mycolicibacterium smegmatis]UAK56203.1 agmatinase [Mycolicibacterium smegmatis]
MTAGPIGAVPATEVPRYAGKATFARIADIHEVADYDIAILGVPFDGGTSYRPGARFGPMAVRQAARTLRPDFHVELGVAPLRTVQVVDAGDVTVTPYDIETACTQIQAHATEILGGADRRIISIGGDHTIALPNLRALHAGHGPVALVHFDAHLDTWDTYFAAPVTHGTIFRRAFEEGLLVEDHSIHIGIRGPIYDRADLDDDARMGFRIIRAGDLDVVGIDAAVDAVKRRVGDTPVYLSVDIDVLDPAFAPGTGTPESGGLSARELLGMLRRLNGLNLVGADVVEVAPAYDHAEITSVAAATVVFDLVSLMVRGSG